MIRHKGYTIRSLVATSAIPTENPSGLTYIQQTLAKDCQWYTTCQDGSHSSLWQARQWIKENRFQGRLDQWIEGPMGAKHPVINRKRERGEHDIRTVSQLHNRS